MSTLQKLKHSYTEISDAVGKTHTGDILWTAIPGATIASSQFNVGEKYLLMIDVDVALDLSNNPDTAGFRVLHGSTVFPGSQKDNHSTSTADSDEGHHYRFFVVWTAIATEAIICEFRVNTATKTVIINHLAMLSLELSVRLTENKDWFYAEDATNVPADFTDKDGASVSFTPDENSDWLILTGVRQTGMHVGIFFGNPSRFLFKIKSAGDFNELSPDFEIFANDNASIDGQYVQPNSRVFSLTKTLNTFTEVSNSGSGQRVFSAIFALNLSKFSAHSFANRTTTIVLTNEGFPPNYVVLYNTLDITPIGGEDVLFGVDSRANIVLQGGPGYHRMQVDNIDVPPSQSVINFGHHTHLNGFDFAGNHTFHGSNFGRIGVKNINKKVTVNVGGSATQGDPFFVNLTQAQIWAFQLTLGDTPVPPVITSITAKNEPSSTTSKNEPSSIDAKHGVSSTDV